MATPEYRPRHLGNDQKWATTLPNGLTVRPGSLSSWPSADYTTSTSTGNSYYVGMEFSSQYVGKHRP